MKKVPMIIYTLALMISLSSVVNAQSLKDLRNKASKLKDKVENAAEGGDNSNSNSNSSSGSQTSSSSSSSSNTDNDFKAWFTEKVKVIRTMKYSLDAESIERGSIDPQMAIEGAKLLDYPNTRAICEKKKLVALASVDAAQYKLMMDYGDYFASHLNAFITKANDRAASSIQNKKTFESTSIEQMKEAVGIADLMLRIVPENAEAQAFKKEIEVTAAPILGAYYAKIYTSDFHRKNAGKILFSDQPIVIGKEDPAQFKTELSGTGNIYAIAYLDGSIYDLSRSFPNGEYQVTIDGDSKVRLIDFKHDNSEKNLSYYIIELIPNPEKAFHSNDAKEFAPILTSMGARKHTLKLGFGTLNTNPFATGTVELDWTNANNANIRTNNQLASTMALDNWARNVKLPNEYLLPSKAFKDPALSVATIKELVMADETLKEHIASIVRVQIGDVDVKSYNDEWKIYKNDLGIITHKGSNRFVGVIFKDADGWCYFTSDLFFKRDYEGVGVFGSPRLYGEDITYTKIDCKNIPVK